MGGCDVKGCDEDHCCEVEHVAADEDKSPSDVCDSCPGFEAAGYCKSVQAILHVLQEHTPKDATKATRCLTAAS